MIVLIWATLFFSLRGCDADTDSSVGQRRYCQNGFCIILNDAHIRAEAGLCLVIPCSFSSGHRFTPLNMVWFKCAPSKPKCDESELIFHPNKNNNKPQSGFIGRVSLLEPDVRLRNCSIVINDLRESDSGSYQFRINVLNLAGRRDGFSFPVRATVSVQALTQRPKVTIPPLTEGRQTTLTCTAPGLCSGSDPEFTWTWGGTGGGVSRIAGNITAVSTENLTAIAQRRISTLTFNSSAEQHSTNVTCMVNFTNSVTTEETATLNVTYVKEIKITGNTTVQESETLTLTCSVESFPPSRITWSKGSHKCMQNGTETNLQGDALTDLWNKTETCLWEESQTGTFSISNVAAEVAGQYICTAKHLNNSLMEKVDVTVTYSRNLTITGDTTVEEGDTLNLTCSVDSVPPARITWSSASSSEPPTGPRGDTGSATLLIRNVTTGHSGRYNCTAQHLDRTEIMFADVTVTIFPKILKSSGCRVQSEVLTCVCISEGLPLPALRWPLLRNLTEYSVITLVSRHRVNSTAILNVKQHGNGAVECVSSNENGEAKVNLISRDASAQVDEPRTELRVVYWLEIVIAFLMGALLSAASCRLATKYRRIKQRSFRNLDETLEMATNQEDPQIDAGQAEEAYQTYQGPADEGAKAALDRNVAPKDVEYASVDFSVLKRKREIAWREREAVTEYAEIKTIKEEREEHDGEDGQMLEGKETEAMMGEDGETKCCGVEEDVYCDPKDMVGES